MLKGHSLDGQTLLCWKDKTFENTWLMPNSRLSILQMEYPNNLKEMKKKYFFQFPNKWLFPQSKPNQTGKHTLT